MHEACSCLPLARVLACLLVDLLNRSAVKYSLLCVGCSASAAATAADAVARLDEAVAPSSCDPGPTRPSAAAAAEEEEGVEGEPDEFCLDRSYALSRRSLAAAFCR